jgi:hypothetical protein
MRCPVCHDEMQICSDVHEGRSLLARIDTESNDIGEPIMAKALWLCGEDGYFAEPLRLEALGYEVVDLKGGRWSSMADSERMKLLEESVKADVAKDVASLMCTGWVVSDPHNPQTFGIKPDRDFVAPNHGQRIAVYQLEDDARMMVQP